MKSYSKNFLLLALVFSIALACSTSNKKKQYLGAWIPTSDSGYRDDTLKITQVEDNIFVDMGGQTLAADYNEASNRLDFQVAVMAMEAKFSLTHIAEGDVLWLTGGVNGKQVFERGKKK